MWDIFESYPAYCDSCNCWHVHTIFYDGESFWQNDGPGDEADTHIEEDEIPSYPEIRAAFAEMYRDIARTGENVPGSDIRASKTVTEKWQVIVRNSVAGWFCLARKNCRGEWLIGKDIPEYIREVLGAELKTPRAARIPHSDFASLDELRQAFVEYGATMQKAKGHIKCIITEKKEVPLTATEIRREAKRLADSYTSKLEFQV